MPTQATKMTSIRLSSEVDSGISRFLERHYYFNRSTFINSVLECVLKEFDENAIYDMARYNMNRQFVCQASFEITKDFKPSALVVKKDFNPQAPK